MFIVTLVDIGVVRDTEGLPDEAPDVREVGDVHADGGLAEDQNW